jgi:hypothetical protein
MAKDIKKMSKEMQDLALTAKGGNFPSAEWNKTELSSYLRGVWAPNSVDHLWHLASIARAMPPDPTEKSKEEAFRQHKVDYLNPEGPEPTRWVLRSIQAYTRRLISITTSKLERQSLLSDHKVSPTDGAVLEKGRSRGGNLKAISEIIRSVEAFSSSGDVVWTSLGTDLDSIMQDPEFLEHVVDLYSFSKPQEWAGRFEKSNWTRHERILAAFRYAILARNDKTEELPIPKARVELLTDPAAARGLKQRVVTVSSVLEYILAAPVNHFLLNALKRTSAVAPILEGLEYGDILERTGPFWHDSTSECLSADLTRASDLIRHSVANAICDGIVDSTCDFSDTSMWGVGSLHQEKGLTQRPNKSDKVKRIYLSNALGYCTGQHLLTYPDGSKVLSNSGVLMGVPLAWPMLNILNLWASDVATGDWRIPDKMDYDNHSLGSSVRYHRTDCPRSRAMLEHYLYRNCGENKLVLADVPIRKDKLAKARAEGISIPPVRSVKLNTLGARYPRLVNGDDFAAFWPEEYTEEYFKAIRSVGLDLNLSKQGRSKEMMIFSETLMHLRPQKGQAGQEILDQMALRANGAIRDPKRKLTLVVHTYQRIPLSFITMAKAINPDGRDVKPGGAGGPIRSVMYETEVKYKGHRRKSIMASIVRQHKGTLEKIAKAKIPLTWPVGLGGMGFIHEPIDAPERFRKAAAVLLTLEAPEAVREVNKVKRIWNQTIPSAAKRKASGLVLDGLELSTSLDSSQENTIDGADALQILSTRMGILASKDLHLSRQDKERPLGYGSMAKKLNNWVRELSSQWASVHPIRPGKACAILNSLQHRLRFKSETLLEYAEILEESASAEPDL